MHKGASTDISKEHTHTTLQKNPLCDEHTGHNPGLTLYFPERTHLPTSVAQFPKAKITNWKQINIYLESTTVNALSHILCYHN